MQRGFSFRRAGRNALGLAILTSVLGACSMAGLPGIHPAPAVAVATAPKAAAPDLDDAYVPLAYNEPAPRRAGNLDGLIVKYAALYDVPEGLIRRVIKRESGYNPRARNGSYLGLMQISHATARSMGYKGSAAGLLDADTNLRYAVKYLRGAYLTAGYSSDGAVRYYSRGYYYDAKRQGLIAEIGLR